MSFFPEIEHVLYINLDERTDRREQVEKELSVFGDRVQRFSAIKNSEHGAIGCTESHINCLKIAKENNWNNILIVEDDFMWKNIEEGFPILEKLLQDPYDVILLGGTYVKYLKDNYRALDVQTTTGYIVNHHYYNKLLENFEKGHELLKASLDRSQYAVDMYWKILQRQDLWYIVIPGLITQRPSYSNIEMRDVNHLGTYI